MPVLTPTNWKQTALVLLIATAVFSLYFQGLMWQPATTVPAFSGDGLTIHYNLTYHATYGKGATLTSQYHPYRESIFMTDAHALIGVALAGLRPVYPNIGDHAIAIANVLVFWSHVLAVWLLFLVLLRLGVRWGLATVMALLIAMISPQIHRQLAGQYTLGFTWLLPLVIWYLLSYDDGKGYLLKSLGVGLVVYLLGLNNPYVYAVAASLILATAGLGLIGKLFGVKAIAWRQLFSWLGVGVLTTLALFLTLRHFDAVDDRVAVPFGFFLNTANWGGLLTSPDVLTYDAIRETFPGLEKPRHENQIYLGIIPMLAIPALPLLGLWNIIVRKSRATDSLKPKTQSVFQKKPLPLGEGLGRGFLREQPILWITFLGSIAGLIFAFTLPFRYFPNWTYAHLGTILQFRAPARFGWPFYYLAALAAGYGLNRIYGSICDKRLATFVVALPLLLWGVEAHQFLHHQLTDRFHDNPLAQEKLNAYRQVAKENQIDTSAYSSIFLLPTEVGWTDKIHHNGTFRSNHDGYQLSLVSGLPLLNGKLSRVSLSRALQSLQMTSDPLVRKTILDELNPDKDILLLASRDEDLDPEEKRLRDLGEVVYRGEETTLLRLNPKAIRAQHEGAIALALADTTTTEDYRRFAYEENEKFAFAGQGSRLVGKGWTDLETLNISDLPRAENYHLSVWVYTDGRRFGGPKFYLKLQDENGDNLKTFNKWINKVYETQRGWQRIDFAFTLPQGTERVQFTANHDGVFYIDEVLLRPANTSVRVDGMYNGYWLPGLQASH